VNKYGSQAERAAAIEAGDTTELDSTVLDGHKHYAVVRYRATRPSEVRENLTGTEYDDLASAQRFAEARDRNDGSGHGAERIA
jgi:hypothetical protein